MSIHFVQSILSLTGPWISKAFIHPRFGLTPRHKRIRTDSDMRTG